MEFSVDFWGQFVSRGAVATDLVTNLSPNLNHGSLLLQIAFKVADSRSEPNQDSFHCQGPVLVSITVPMKFFALLNILASLSLGFDNSPAPICLQFRWGQLDEAY